MSHASLIRCSLAAASIAGAALPALAQESFRLGVVSVLSGQATADTVKALKGL